MYFNRPDLLKTRLQAVLLAGAALGLGACAPNRVANSDTIASDYRARHAIVVGEAPVTLDLFPAGVQMGFANRDRVRNFAAAYQRDGRGPISIQIPQGSSADAQARAAVDGIRRDLAAAGARGFVNVSTYPVTDPSLASPVRLSYLSLKASVANKCGEWPRDLASGSSLEGWNNTTYWNHGCAHQNMLAQQVADPRDLVAPQGETSSDVPMRTRAITSVRKGTDPSTTWTVKSSNIGSAGGQ
ncbi:MAG: pilus assembly protein CpaD [Hyphomicrobiales bacterium]|nr:pilus assembly protein CpaD [Hyphomicrobiales bacterium]